MKNSKHPADFSTPTIAQQALRSTLEHPAVVYPAVLGVLGVVGAMAFDASLWMLGFGVAGLIASTSSWGVNFGLRRDEFARRYVQRMTREIEADRQARLTSIEQALKEMNTTEGKSQFRRLREKFTTFRDMLNKKFDPTELVHARYLGMGEQVYLAVLDNLNTVVNLLRNLAAIDRSFIDDRLVELSKQQDNVSSREREALEQRRALYEQQHTKVRELLSTNETAMTRLDHTLAAIADMRSDDSHASMDLESAMNELTRIALRTKDLSQ